MSMQERSGSMDVPVCPPQTGGWACLVSHDQNISWKVCAKRGSRAEHNMEIRIIGRLSQEDVRNFNIGRYR